MRDLWRRQNRQRQHHLQGQTLVEFALVLPLLLVLLLGIADFGRVFAAGITLEAAARNAAEIVAEEYRRNPPDGQYADLTLPAPSPGDVDYYQPLHELAARVACREAASLENATFDSSTETCPLEAGAAEAMPVIMVCIHDGADPLCANPGFGVSVADHPECTSLASAPTNAMEGGDEESRYVEVRLCYRFSMLIHTQLLPLGDVWLQKDRAFTVAYYPPPPTPVPPSPPPSPSPGEIPTEEPSPTPEESSTPTPEPTPEPETPTPSPESDTPSPIPTETPAQ